MVELMQHQRDALERTAAYNKCAFYHDMGLGKTFTGAEKMMMLGAAVNIVVCQKSKIDDWLDHFKKYYPKYKVLDLTKPKQLAAFINDDFYYMVGVINYDLIYRRPELLKIKAFTLMLDESSIIQNDTIKRTKFIMKMQYENLILLSGTPTAGRYEHLYSQLKMLGYEIRKNAFFEMYCVYHVESFGGWGGSRPIIKKVVDGYKNVDHLKRKMRRLGCDFLKTSEVMDLPQQQFIPVRVPVSSDYKTFCKKKIIEVDNRRLIGENVLIDFLILRQLAGAYSKEKLQAFEDLINSTDNGMVVFYNFEIELQKLKSIAIAADKPISIINGSVKDLTAYNNTDNAVVFIQYQAGAMGLNLQKYNHIIYFTPPVRSELYEQSKKRIHRIGQNQTCFYYNLICDNSIERNIYNTLAMRKDYTDELFKQNYLTFFV